MTERVLSTRRLNRALLARQLLLDRTSLPLTRAIERVGGLQTQYAPSGYVSLWSRLRDLPRDALTRALETRRVVQATLMRVTIHMVSTKDSHLFSAGVGDGRRAWWLRTWKGTEGLDMEAVAAYLRKILSRGPRRARELRDLLRDRGWPDLAWSGVGLWVDLVRVPPSGTWEQRRADLYGLADDWLRPDRPRPTNAEGLEHLVRRYLGGFGPASVKDIASWAGLTATTLVPVVERLGLRRFRDERGGLLFDLPGAPLPDADAPAPVRFIPTWEATLLVHARRTQFLPESYRPLVFNTRTPHSVGTFTVDGAVAGAWRHEGGRVRLEPFETLPRSVRSELHEEARGLEAFHAEGRGGSSARGRRI